MPRTVVAVVSLAILLASLPAACLPNGSTITAAMRSDDDRLNLPVTTRVCRIYVGDLLDRWSKQTGVTLKAGRYDGAEDAQVFVSVRNGHLGDCLDGLWAMLSYKDAEYRWERTGKTGAYVYTLTRSLAAQRLAERLRNLTQELFEKQAARMIEAAQAPPDRREGIVSAMVADMFGGDEELTKGLLEGDRLWAGLRTYAETLSPDDQLKVLSGQVERIRVPTSQLSDAGKAFVHSVWGASQASRRHSDGTTEPVPEPSYLQFHTDRIGNTDSPSLFIELEDIGGYSYCGGDPLEKAVRKRVGDLWQPPGERTSAGQSTLSVPPASSSDAADGLEEKKPGSATFLQRRLDQIAQATGTPVIGRLPERTPVDPGDPHGRKLADYLADAASPPPHPQYKWSSGALLVDYPAWFWDEPGIVPLKLVRTYRELAKKNDGFFTLQALMEACRTIPNAWLVRLSDDFPSLASLAQKQDLLNALCPDNSSLDALQSEQGVPLTDALAALLRSDIFLRDRLGQRSYQALAMRTLDYPDHKPPAKEYCLGLIDRNGKWEPVTGIGSLKNGP